MADRISNVVKAISSAHSSLHKNLSKFSSAASDPKQFPKVTMAVVLSSGLVGFALMQIIDGRRENSTSKIHLHSSSEQQRIRNRQNAEMMSQNESLVRAMIENAKSSSARENLENAAMAQQNFMLVPSQQSPKERKFLEQIAKRSKEIRNSKE